MNPFIENHDHFFRPYSASRILQDIVLSLYNDHNAISLGKIRVLDQEHYTIAKSCLDTYWNKGEATPGFLDLARTIIENREAEKKCSEPGKSTRKHTVESRTKTGG